MPKKILAEKEGEAYAPTSNDETVVTQPAEEENTDETIDEATDEVEEAVEVEQPSLKAAGMTHCTAIRRLHMHNKIYEIGTDIVLENEQALELEAKGNVTIA